MKVTFKAIKRNLFYNIKKKVKNIKSFSILLIITLIFAIIIPILAESNEEHSLNFIKRDAIF